MFRKVYVTVTTKLIINVDYGVEIDNIISEMDCNFASQTEGAEIIDSNIDDYEVTDSK